MTLIRFITEFLKHFYSLLEIDYLPYFYGIFHLNSLQMHDVDEPKLQWSFTLVNIFLLVCIQRLNCWFTWMTISTFIQNNAFFSKYCLNWLRTRPLKIPLIFTLNYFVNFHTKRYNLVNIKLMVTISWLLLFLVHILLTLDLNFQYTQILMKMFCWT